MQDENENQNNFNEDVAGVQSNEAEMSERDAAGMMSEEEEVKVAVMQPQMQSQPSAYSNLGNQGRRCSNDMCPMQSPYEVVKVQKGPYEYLCNHCFSQYKDDHFCYYCKQIYFGEDDGECWIECDKCNKWTHADCEEQRGDYKDIKQQMSQAAQFPFECPNCRPRPRFEKKISHQVLAKEKLKLKRNDIILNNYGFFWRLKPEEIQSDLEKLRSL